MGSIAIGRLVFFFQQWAKNLHNMIARGIFEYNFTTLPMQQMLLHRAKMMLPSNWTELQTTQRWCP